MIVDGQLYQASVGASSLDAITAIEANGEQVKSQPNPRFVGAIAYSADLQYFTLHNSTSWGGVDPAFEGAPAQLNEHGRPMDWRNPTPVVTKSTYIFKAFQDNAGAQEVNGIISTAYELGQSIPCETAMGLPVGRRVSKGANLTADAWTPITAIDDLKTNKRYAILSATGIGTDARAVRFKHTDFFGLTPVLPTGDADNLGLNKFRYLPTFRGEEALQVEGFAGTAQDMTVIVNFLEL